MEQDMFFITEVDVDVDDKSFINVADDRITSNQKRKKRESLKVTNIEKRILAKLVEQEPMLWDRNDEMCCNNNALSHAWNRIVKKMPGRNGMWYIDVKRC